MFNPPKEINIMGKYKITIINTSFKTFIQPIYSLIQQDFAERIMFLQVYFHWVLWNICLTM